MLYKEFGNTGEKVSAIGVGTWKLGRDPKAEIQALGYAVSNGVTLIDTAEMYGTEGIVNDAIKGFDRGKLFIATKVSPHNFHYSDVLKSCKASLMKLEQKYIDLYQLHWPNHSIPIAETMSAMEKLVDEGKVRHIGVSNFSIKEFEEAEASMKRYGIISDQVEYSVFVRGIEREHLPEYCASKNAAIMAYSPLNRGSIGKDGSSSMHDALSAIAERHGKTVAQVALNWLALKSNVFPIPKAASIEHMRENIESTGFKLSDKEKGMIDSIRESKRQLGGVFRPLLKKNAIWSKAMARMNRKNEKKSGAEGGE